jgi:sporulation protein YlmC with PRC-barrel domain
MAAGEDRSRMMTQPVQFTIGARVSCTDGVCGQVIRVVVDPVARAVTHLVVEPKDGGGLGRLVPLSLVQAGPDGIRLGCTQAEFGQLETAQEIRFAPGGRGRGADGPADTLSWPYYSLNMGAMGIGMEGAPGTVVYDKVPLNEVEVRRGEHVHAIDGNIGRVQGLVIDPSDHHVSHVLLQEGHLWGSKEVAIPISAVIRVDDGIRLSISKQQVQDLPPVDVDHLNG